MHRRLAGGNLLQTHHRGAQDKHEQCTERAVENFDRAVHQCLRMKIVNWRNCQFGKVNSW